MKRVVLEPHDPAWTQGFEQWRVRLSGALHGRALAIDHIGSTAIPGIHAKPIIDVLVARRLGEVFEVWGELLAPLGLTHSRLDSVGRGEGQWFFRDLPRTIHVHVYEQGPAHQRHLVFRNALLRDDQLRTEYDQLKQSLARRDLRDMDEYIQGKGAFVRKVETNPGAKTKKRLG